LKPFLKGQTATPMLRMNENYDCEGTGLRPVDSQGRLLHIFSSRYRP
jgi:hypothetical protein